MLAVVTIAAAEPGRLGVASVVALALAWGTCGSVADLLTAVSPSGAVLDGGDRPSSEPAGVTTVVRLGEEPDEIVRMCVSVALALGPVTLVSTGREPPAALPAEVTTLRCDTVREALRSAATASTTEAILVVSGRAIVSADACRAAAARLGPDVGWVIGRSEPLNLDRYGSDRRASLDQGLRHRARRIGLWTWEPDATLVRRDLLRDDPFPSGRPFGRWLREHLDQGVTGVCVDEVISRRAVPVAAGRHWPFTAARQRGLAADLSDAARRRSAPRLTRAVAVALLARALFGWPLLVWACAPVLLAGGFPVTVSPVAWASSLIVLTVLRWAALRRALGRSMSPRGELVAALYDAPGSLASTGAALTGRVRPSRSALPSATLAWLAAVVALSVSTQGVLSYSPGTSGSRMAALASVFLLGLLWSFSARAVVERNWARAGFRVPLDLDASVRPDGESRGEATAEDRTLPAKVIDGSPGGLAVAGDGLGIEMGLDVGGHVELEIAGVGAAPLSLSGVIASHRRRRGEHVLGVEILPPDRGEIPAGWFAELVRSSRPEQQWKGRVATVVEQRLGRRDRVLRSADRFLVAMTVVVSTVALVALVGALLGFRPLVVRSSSMEPALAVGDLVLVELVPVSEVSPGDVVSRLVDPGSRDDLTHRVVSSRTDADVVYLDTKGDANPSGESWRLPADELVGRMVLSIPIIGGVLSMLRAAGLAIFVVAGLVLLGMLVRSRSDG